MGLRIIETDRNGEEHRVLTREQLDNAYNIIKHTPASNTNSNDATFGLISLGDYSFKFPRNGDITDKLILENQQQMYKMAVEDLADHPELFDYAQAAQALNQAGPNDRLLMAFDSAAKSYINETNSPYIRENQVMIVNEPSI